MNDFKHLILKSYKYWDIQIHSNQSYLGRCVLWYTGTSESADLFDISHEERAELWEITNHLKTTLKTLFEPNHFNYAALGNESRHIHIHVIPRYKTPKTFDGYTFTDTRWGHNPYPYDKTFKLPDSIFQKIKNTIETAL